MKKFYILTILISVIMLTNAFAQEKFPEKGNEKDKNHLEKDDFESKTNKDFLLEKEQQTSTNKGEFYRDSSIRYNFSSENDSVLSRKSLHEYDGNGNMTLWIWYNWDSTNEVWEKSTKDEYEYYTDENRTLKFRYEWESENDEWIRDYKREYEYDANGNQTLFAHYDWDSTNELWIGDFKVEYKYDGDGNRTLHFHYNWDSSSETWIEMQKSEYEYNNDGNRTLVVGYSWDSTNEVWKKSTKVEYEYDDNENQILGVSYHWSGTDGWEKTSKKEYDYDADGNQTLEVYYQWDSTNEVWKKGSKREWEYDGDGNQTLKALYIWDSTNEVWIGDFKNEWEYDGNGDQTLFVIYTWDSTNEVWEKSTKVEYEYDGDGNWTLYAHYTWDSTNEVWIIDWKEFFYYTIKFHVSVNLQPENGGKVSGDSIYNMGDEVTLKANPNESYKFINWTDSADSEVSDDSVYTFTMPSEDVSLTANFDGQTGVWKDNITKKINVYPNPANQYINISAEIVINKIIISDLTGKVVYNRKMKDPEIHISTEKFNTGLYIMQIHTDKGIFQKKILIQK